MLSVTAQIAIADTACIVLLPLVIDPSHAPRAALGDGGSRRLRPCRFRRSPVRATGPGGASACTTTPRTAGGRWSCGSAWRSCSGLAHWRGSTHVSIMLAGFALGLVVAAVGEPRRLARQLFGITEGFFGPLFFVWLGASLQVRDLGAHPRLILLGVALGAGAVVAHAAGACSSNRWRWRSCRRTARRPRRRGDDRNSDTSLATRRARRPDARRTVDHCRTPVAGDRCRAKSIAYSDPTRNLELACWNAFCTSAF